MIDFLDAGTVYGVPGDAAAAVNRAALLAQLPGEIGARVLSDLPQPLRLSQRPNFADPAIRSLPLCALAIALALIEG